MFRCVFHREDDQNWPEPDRVGRQELEIVLGDEHISFTVKQNLFNKIKSLNLSENWTIDVKNWVLGGRAKV